MLRGISLRLAVPLALVATLLSAAVGAQSQDTQSVAEAARRAREKKKVAPKPARVITEDDVKPAAPTASQPAPAPADSSSSNTQAAPASAGTASTPAPKDEKGKDEKKAKELADLKALIKQVQDDFDVLQREQSLEQDTYFSNPDYTHDTEGKAKLDALKQQIADKQVELERLKARLLELQPTPDTPTNPPPKP